MPIGPKHRLGEPGSTVARQFTDREQFIGVFEEAVAELPPTEYQVLVYYGVGGIGKTKLRIELCRLLERKHLQTMWAVLDFRNTTYRDMETALFWLRQELNRKYVVQFPSFDLAYVTFWQKSHPQTSLRQDPTQLEALLEEGTLFANLVSIVGEVPIVSLVPKLSKAISKTDRLFREWWTKRGHQDLYKLQEMEPAEIVNWLPAFWASDLKDYLERNSRPLVLFMDTYEALWEGEGRRTEGRFFTQDAWVRELVSQLPEVLWVITGRERVRWEELDEEWRNYQHQHLVGGLPESDARKFLASCGVTEEALQKVIVEGSKGVPLYLDLAVDTYLQIKDRHERAPSASDFRGAPRDVLDRFLHYLDRSETETLKVLSVARFWDRELFESLIEEFNTGYPATALPELSRFSFVQEEQIPDTWTIHPLMREALEEHLDAELRGHVHRQLFNHYNDSLKDLESMTIGDVHKMALTEAFHHAKHILDAEEIFEWFTAIDEVFRRAALWQFLIPLREELAKLMEGGLGLENPNTLRSFRELADLYSQQGRYEEAEALLRRALEIQEKVLGEENPETAITLNNLGLVYRQQGRYEEAEPLYRRTLEVYEKVIGEEDPETATTLNNLAELHRKQGRYNDAEPLYKRALEIWERVLGEEAPNTVAVLNNLGALYNQQGRYGEAEPVLRRALEVSEKISGEEHPNTAQILDNLGSLYYLQQRYEEAEALLRRAVEIREKVLGEEHPNTLQSLNNLGSLYLQQERYGEAEPVLRRALEVQEKVLGEEHHDTSTALNNLGSLYYLQQRYEEAEPLVKRGLEISEKILGAEHPETIVSLDNLGSLYLQQGRYEKAEALFRQVLEVAEKALGKGDPATVDLLSNTAQRLDNLGSLYLQQGRYEKAEALFRQVLEVAEKALGKGDPATVDLLPDTVQSLYDLAGFYYRQERYEEAESLLRRVLEVMEKILGKDDPATVALLNNLVLIYRQQGRYEEAERLMLRFS